MFISGVVLVYDNNDDEDHHHHHKISTAPFVDLLCFSNEYWCPEWWSKRRPCTLVQTNLVGAPSPDFRLCFPLMTYEGCSAGPRPLGDEPYMHL